MQVAKTTQKMGKVSKKLAERFRDSRNRKVVSLKDYAEAKQEHESSVKNIKQLVENGYDPLHAAYVSAQNLTSLFAEVISELPELEEYYSIVGAAEDEYLPDGPPFSPLTRSYFTTWAFFDVQFGQDKETIGTCLLDSNRHLKIRPEMIEIIRQMQSSRMGIYEHYGIFDSLVILRELVTEEEFYCHVPSGYLGKKGQLWFVRILPPIHHLVDYSVVFTTPYVFVNATKMDWLAFLDRTLPKVKASDKKEALYILMKYGMELNYWNEYIFQAYYNSLNNVIFLAGLPDIKESRPHAE
jgi:hypothetical protein